MLATSTYAINSTDNDSVNDSLNDSNNSSSMEVSSDLNRLGTGSPLYVSTTGNNSGDGTYNDPYDTLSKAIDEVSDGGTIYISGTFTGDLYKVINKNVTIIGLDWGGDKSDGPAVMDSSENQILKISVNSSVTLKNITFTGANKPSSNLSGAISSFGNLTCDNCTFNNNIASDASGGAIHFKGLLNVSNCIFTNNSGPLGGVIYYDADNTTDGATYNLYVNNCSFENNIATSHGGAIDVVDGNNTTLDMPKTEILNSNFINNAENSSAPGTMGGGAINVHYVDYFTCYNCNFISNHANKNGGAICIQDNGTKTNITSCNFDNNSANNDGSAIYIVPGLGYTGGDGIINNCNFSDNKDSAGTIYVSSSNGINILNSNFNDNNASAIYLSNVNNSNLTNLNLTNNLNGVNITGNNNNLSVVNTINNTKDGIIFSVNSNSIISS
jgi:predicted outer membrane repeat protein